MPSTPHRLLRLGFTLTLASALVTCTDNTAPDPTAIPTPDAPRLFRTPTGLMSATAPEIFVGAGDIASCSKTGDSLTAALLDSIPVVPIFTLGDNVYENGTTSEFENCYAPTWGRFKDRTYPSAGNHEYNTPDATPYYDYFGDRAGPRGLGYYSFDLGAWHIVVLNSNIAKGPTSPQVTWLRQDLADHPNQCTLAYFHHPLYSSTGGTGTGGVVYSGVRTFYDTLYAAGADLILAGHRHVYERMAPVRPDGTPDDQFGTRVIIVGSGGIGGGSATNLHPASEAVNGNTRGVLRLHLYEDSYAWKFIPVTGGTFTDSGSTACHSRPSAGTGVVSPSLSTVTVSPARISASSGSIESAITVTAKDESGAPMGGAMVVLSGSGAGNIVTQPSGPTNADGIATGFLSSSIAGRKVVTAEISAVTIAQRPTINVVPGNPARLAFSVQPRRTTRGATISPAVKVQIRDQFGNRVTGATDNLTIALGRNPASGTLAGTTTVPAVRGMATFSDLSIDKAGKGYTLVASSGSLTPATSRLFNITVP
jgi:hypothetical protein